MFKRGVFVLFVLLLTVSGMVSAQDGVSVDCGDGFEIENGVEVQIVTPTPGTAYRATVIGIGDFDPVLAVFDSEGNGGCNDDGEEVANYGVDLLTTGEVAATTLSSQLDFTYPRNGSGPISLVVGGYGGSAGAFVLVIEGMALTGDEPLGGIPVAVNVSQPLVNSGVTLTTYLISTENSLDTALYLINSNGEVVSDSDGSAIYCDDSGDESTCFGGAHSLEGSSVSVERETFNATEYDSVLNLALTAFPLSNDRSQNYLNLLMASYNGELTGEFVAALHMGIGEASGNGGGGENPPPRQGGGGGNPPPRQGGGASPTETPENSGGGGNPPPRQGGGASPTETPESGGGGGGINPPPRQGGGGGSGQGSDELPHGYAVDCGGSTGFTNGVELVISQMRSGYTYTATVVGLNGFDPVLAVIDPNGNGLCNDDDATAADYAASLPTTGRVPASSRSSQVRFDQNSSEAFADVSLVVGGFGDQMGEFLLILEGMAATAADNGGDPFYLGVTQPMLNSGIPVTVYMMTRGTSGVDPVIYLLDGDNVMTDSEGNDVYCDDAGDTSRCYGFSERLDNYNVTINTGTLPGWQFDSMLSLPLEGFSFDPDMNNYLGYLMSSYGTSEGQYLLVFHVGTSD